MASLLQSERAVGSSPVLTFAYYAAAAALCGVTVTANLSFGLTLGSTPIEKAIYATASVAADIIKCTTLVVLIRLWQTRQLALVCVGTVLGAICLAWSTASAVGFSLSTREHTAALYAAAGRSSDGWTTIIRRADDQLALIGHSRPPAVIEADLASQLVPAAIWRRTQGCAELTVPESHTACARVVALRQELAAAQSVRALEERIAEARGQLAAAPVMGASADPQVAGLGAVMGIDEPTLRLALALLLGLLVEVGSGCGFAVARAATATPPPQPKTPTPAGRGASSIPASSKVVRLPERRASKERGRQPAIQSDASMVRWAEQCVRRDDHGRIGARAAYQAYCRWAQAAGLSPVTETKFGRVLTSNITAMGGSKSVRSKGAFYLGIRLVQGLEAQAVRMAA